MAFAAFAPFHAGQRVADRQVIFRAGDADVGQTPLLFDGRGGIVVDRALMRQQTLFPPDQIDAGEFESLRAVEGHQSDGRFFRLVLLAELAIVSVEGRFFEELDQTGPSGALLVLTQGRHAFFDHSRPSQLLMNFLVLLGDFRLVVDHIDQRLEGRSQAGSLRAESLAVLFEQLAKRFDGGCGLGSDFLLGGGLGHDVPNLAARLHRTREQLLDRRIADAARRSVDDPQQRNLVGGVSDCLEIRHQIADLFAVEE